VGNPQEAAAAAQRLATAPGPWQVGEIAHGRFGDLWQGSANDLSDQGTADRTRKADRIVWRVDLSGPNGRQELYIDESTGELLGLIGEG
jgi:hypothetical protein